MNHYQISVTLKIARLLKSSGKRCFVNCFEHVQQNYDLTIEDIKKYDPEVGESIRGLETRRSCIMRIFNEVQECAALNQCCDSKRLSQATIAKAKDLLQKYEQKLTHKTC